MLTRLRTTAAATALAALTLTGWAPSGPGSPPTGPGGLSGDSTSDPVGAAESLGLSCSEETSSDGVAYHRCSGEIPSFDSVGLDTDLFLPADAADPLPTIAMLHGWGGSKTDWQATSRDGDGAGEYRWNNVWFVSRGFAALTYTARGFHDSCGQLDLDPVCASGYTHLASRDFETRDTQHLLGLLVDVGVADRSELAATGGSYGGGQSWNLATSLPWTSPGGAEDLQLAAAVPLYPWTDLYHSLVPNGRADDDIDQSDSHEQPFGIMKESYVTGLLAIGRAGGEGRYNTALVTDVESALDVMYTRVQAGEPYDGDPTAATFAAAFRNKSAYYADDYVTAVANGTVEPVPVFSVQGWTDPLFPAAETLQMYRKLTASVPDYPIYMAFGDVGHSNAKNPAYQWEHINRQGNQFLNTFLLGRGRGLPTSNVLAFETPCPGNDADPAPIAGTGWDRLAGGQLVLVGTGSRTTTSVPTNLEEGLATDPILNGGCLTSPAPSDPLLDTTWSWPVPAGGLTQVGLSELQVSYTLAGVDATVAVKLWDLAADGTRTLVDRGVYRLSVAAGDPTAGVLDFDLFGNAWPWNEGHTIQLQVAQTDAAFLRPDNLASTITFADPQLRIPTREGSTRTVADDPAGG